MRSISALCIWLAMTGLVHAEGDWTGLEAWMDRPVQDALNIFTPCEGSASPHPECQVAHIRCTDRIELTLAVPEKTLSAWISSTSGFFSDLSVGNSERIRLRPFKMSLNEENGDWLVELNADPDAELAERPGDIRIDLPVDSLVVSAAGRNLEAIRTLIDRCRQRL